jgi:hypothetical protein
MGGDRSDSIEAMDRSARGRIILTSNVPWAEVAHALKQIQSLPESH